MIRDDFMPARPVTLQASPSPQKRLMALLRVERNDLLILTVYSLVVGILTLVVPFAVQALVNTAGFGTMTQPLVVLAGLVFLGLGFSSLVQTVQAFVIEMIQRRVFVRVASHLAWRLPRVQSAAFDTHHGPELVNRFFDVLTIQKGSSSLLLEGLSIVIQAFIGLFLVSLYHPVLLIYSLVVACALAIILGILGSNGTSTIIKESKAKYGVAAWLEEIVRHPIAFKSSGGAQLAQTRTEELLNRYLDTRRQHFRVFIRQVVALLVLYAIASSVLLGVGGWLVIQGQLSLGQLVAAEFILTMVVGGFAKLGKQIEAFYDLLAAMDKLGQLTDLPLESQGLTTLPNPGRPLEVTLEGVSFGYPEGPTVLSDVNLQIRPGEHIAILGGHGTGKSTLLDLLVGLRDADSGNVMLDNITTRELDRTSLRKQVDLVREIEVFDGTLLENVRMAREHLQEADIREALRAVGLLENVNRLPDGLHTRLFTGGGPLSPGEARRLILARAMAGRPRLLLLDEFLGHLDVACQALILDKLFDRESPWTLVAVTYNRLALARCQRIFELRDGALREVSLPPDFGGDAKTVANA